MISETKGVWEQWYPGVSPLQAGIFTAIAEILKTSLEEAGSAEQAAEFFSEHNLRFITSLYGMVVQDLGVKCEDEGWVRASFGGKE